MLYAFRGEKDAAISGAGFVVAVGAYTSTAPTAPPRHHPELTASFPRPWLATKCVKRFTPSLRDGFLRPVERGALDGREVCRVIEDAVNLAKAGVRMDVDELSEKTGYRLEESRDAATRQT